MLAFGFCLIYSFIIASPCSPFICTAWNARPQPPPKCAHACENGLLFSPPLHHLLHLSRGQSHACRCSGQKPRGHPAPLSLSHSTSVNWEAVRPSCHHRSALVHVRTVFRLDYCSSFLTGGPVPVCPQPHSQSLHLKWSSDHSTLLLRSLQRWLPLH